MLSYVAGICLSAFHKVTIVSAYKEIKEEYKHPKINYVDLGIHATGLPTWRFSAIMKIRQAVKDLDAKYVCGWASEMAFMVRVATLGMDRVVISAERNDPYTLPFIWKLLEKWTYRKSDYAFFQLDKARDFYGSSMQCKSFVIPNSFVPSTKLLAYAGERKKTIVSAGRFQDQKGFDVLIKAFAKVFAVHPAYKLIIYGEGPLDNEYRKLADELGVSEAMELPGYTKDFESEVYDEGVFVLSSRFEGIPNSLIEAMSTGIPTVSTDCTPGGPDFLTNHGERGLLVKVEDVDGLASSILYLIENKAAAEEIGEKGKEVINLLDEKKITSMWIETLNKIIKERAVR